jgi:hypothetical protein
VADQIEIQIPRTATIKEGSHFTATAYFRTRSTSSASTPTTIKYRLDCLTSGSVLTDWTSVGSASNVSIAVTGTHNAIQSDANDVEVKQLTVMADEGLATQVRQAMRWRVTNLFGSP